MTVGREGNVKWVDGLRGLASFLVVVTHLARAWDSELFYAASSEDAAPRLLQLPYIRVLIQGRIGYIVFAFVTGYVCALKPIRQCKQGQQEAALVSISNSALRRIPRLVLPAAAATCLSFLICETGLYAVAKHQDSWWLDVTTPDREPYLLPALWSLVCSLFTTWTSSINHYDGHQWTLLPLLRGSIWVYAFMVGTAYARPRQRMLMSLGFWLYFYLAGDAAFGMQFFWGVLLADLQNDDSTAALIASRPLASSVLSAVLVTLGLLLASYPEAHADRAGWSQALTTIMTPFAPNIDDLPRLGSGLGLELISAGIVLSPALQRALSSRHLLFFGRMSFAVYLLHGPLMKTTLVWLLYGVQAPPDRESASGDVVMTRFEYPGAIALVAWQVVWLPMLYAIANMWMTYVDPWCERMTKKLVNHVKLGASEKPPVLPVG